MYKHLMSYLEDDLKTFDAEDCRKVRKLIKYLENTKDVPLSIIKKQTYEYYEGYCKGKNVKPMTEWQFDLCKTEMEW